MNVRKRRDLPAPLEGVRRRFEQWRRTHKARARIPNRLWIAAVKMGVLPAGEKNLEWRAGDDGG